LKNEKKIKIKLRGKKAQMALLWLLEQHENKCFRKGLGRLIKCLPLVATVPLYLAKTNKPLYLLINEVRSSTIRHVSF